jgi:streptogramin lyase
MRRLGALALLVAIPVSLGAVPPAAVSQAAPSRIVEYDIPSTGVPEHITAGPDGALWFSERYTTQIGRVTVAGRFKLFSFPMNNHMSTDITTGPDAALWFTFPNSVTPYDTGKIGRITTTGHATFFDIPWVSDAESITAGPDGNLWFADHVAASIARLTPTGTFTRFSIPGPPGTYPWQLVDGPDGALWFTDINGHRIGRITTTGQVSFFAVPDQDGYPDGIASGPDGNVWFTLDDEANIGRITPEGVITEFAVPHPEGHYIFLSGIASVSAQALAFTYYDLVTGESLVGRITTTGTISTLPTPTPESFPSGITSGPNGSVWFTEVVGPSVAGITRGGSVPLG